MVRPCLARKLNIDAITWIPDEGGLFVVIEKQSRIPQRMLEATLLRIAIAHRRMISCAIDEESMQLEVSPALLPDV
jgi:hypothetical protein